MNEDDQPVKDIVLDSAGQPEIEEKLIGVSCLPNSDPLSNFTDNET